MWSRAFPPGKLLWRLVHDTFSSHKAETGQDGREEKKACNHSLLNLHCMAKSYQNFAGQTLQPTSAKCIRVYIARLSLLVIDKDQETSSAVCQYGSTKETAQYCQASSLRLDLCRCCMRLLLGRFLAASLAHWQWRQKYPAWCKSTQPAPMYFSVILGCDLFCFKSASLMLSAFIAWSPIRHSELSNQSVICLDSFCRKIY